MSLITVERYSKLFIDEKDWVPEPAGVCKNIIEELIKDKKITNLPCCFIPSSYGRKSRSKDGAFMRFVCGSWRACNTQ